MALVDPPRFPVRLAAGETLSVWVRLLSEVPRTATGTVRVSPAGGSEIDVPVTLAPPGPGPCLVVQPAELSFGATPVNCNSTSLTVGLYNQCASPITIERIDLVKPGGQPAGGPDCPSVTACPSFFLTSSLPRGTILAPNTSATVRVKHRPLATGPEDGALRVDTDTGQSITIVLRGVGGEPTVAVDTWPPGDSSQLDLVWLIDASPSFVPKRAAVRANLLPVLAYSRATSACHDFRWAFAAAEGAADAGAKLLTSDAGLTWFSARSPDFEAQALSALDSLPVGSEDEACVGPAAQLLTAPDSGIRPGAPLSLLCVTDALDHSPDPMASLAALRALGPFWGWSVFGGMASSTCPIEATDDGVHAALAAAGGGTFEDICEPYWGSSLLPADSFCGLRTYFTLAQRSASPELTVTVDGQPVPPIGPLGDLIWRYEHTTNSVEFQPASAPAYGSTVQIRYGIACVP
jgi:hypothetical protein